MKTLPLALSRLADDPWQSPTPTRVFCKRGCKLLILWEMTF